ncbi:unnamed protein product [Orchesella dallaii]|uniref:ABC transporter G family member 23 n=1 Tax=Orchesella dallaii TaxID=48710 RepID=A0ABP1QTI8_9HEXA
MGQQEILQSSTEQCCVSVPENYGENSTTPTPPPGYESVIPVQAIMREEIVVPEKPAIKVEKVYKAYEKNHPILSNLEMTVPRGSIYGLLGSSGCGKTSILSCIVGRQTWDAGSISILGSPPYLKRCAFDSKKLGYMPQDLALQPLLTIEEVLILYGRLHGMSTDTIISRMKFLQTFLQLPDGHRTIDNLSGGQQRRASLAVSLLHEPDLIILDEPTVGLDPLLRQSIWEHLQNLVENFQVTVLLTTHYIDEARRSHQIGLMRNGRLIAEESPKNLIKKYDTASLDTIVLQICKRDAVTKHVKSHQINNIEVVEHSSSISVPPIGDGRKVFHARGKLAKIQGQQQVMMNEDVKGVTFLSYNDLSQDSLNEHVTPAFSKELTSTGNNLTEKCMHSSLGVYRRLMGLVWATYMSSFRHPAFIWLTFVLPLFSTALIQIVFGTDLHDLRFGIVDYDGSLINASFNDIKASCLETKFSQLFLSKIPSGSLTLIPFADDTQAIQSVQRGDSWGYVNIPINYTANMKERMLARQFSTNETIIGSIIGIHMDMSSYLGSLLILQKLSTAYETFLQELGTSCGLPSEELEIPLKYKPVYTETDGATYAHHIVPGLILFMIFVLPLGACSVAVIQERNQGRLDRMKVAGMANWDVVVAFFVTHGSFQLVQMLICSVVLIVGFSYEIKGSIWLYVFLNLCNAFCGLAFGFLLGVVCATELQAIIIVFAITSFLLPFCGAVWPVEILEHHWRLTAYALPTTLTSQSLRSIIFRGLSITHSLVWPGIAVTAVWTSVFLTLGLIYTRNDF